MDDPPPPCGESSGELPPFVLASCSRLLTSSTEKSVTRFLIWLRRRLLPADALPAMHMKMRAKRFIVVGIKREA